MKFRLTTGVLIAALTASTVFAGGHNASPEEKAVKARQAHMQLYAFNLGILGAMAKGDMEYNADLATAVAGDLANLAAVTQAAYWPPNTTNEDIEGSRALAAGWENVEATMAIYTDMIAATQAMAEAAGTIDGVRASIGAIGKACGDCHKATRAPNN
ncbi:MAG: cytochrome c [Pseudomonadota bacterium]